MVYLFAYGSLSPEILAKDVGLPIVICAAGFLPKHIMTFSSQTKKWNGGVASVLYTGNRSDMIIGIVYDISSRQLEQLDRIEGPMYARALVHVQLRENRSLPCQMYVKTQDLSPVVPSQEYLEHINTIQRIAHHELRQKL